MFGSFTKEMPFFIIKNNLKLPNEMIALNYGNHVRHKVWSRIKNPLMIMQLVFRFNKFLLCYSDDK